MKRALISVSDKTGIIEFAKKLSLLGYEIISTGGTLQTLLENDIKAISVSSITGFPEIMDGRVKTLHPKIHGGILYRRDDEKHIEQAKEHGIIGIDLLVVNLYPFEKYAESFSTQTDRMDSVENRLLIENIDIGGPAMLRAGAKNFQYVTVLIDPADYEIVLQEIEKKGDTLLETRQRLAIKVFFEISKYDDMISRTFYELQDTSYKLQAPPTFLMDNGQWTMDNYPLSIIHYPFHIELRYGENPHQSASFYQNEKEIITKLHGKELSYNNFLDIDAAMKTIMKFIEPTVAILKHTNPCGIASDYDISKAYKKAFTTDTISPFGGVVISNDTLNLDFVETIDKIFTEIVIAPDFQEDALKKLKKKKDRRIIKYHPDKLDELKNHLQIQPCLNGYLTQMPDLIDDCFEEWTFPSKKKPTEIELIEMKFAWQVVKMLKSNAICFTSGKQTLGLGIGQTSRISALNIAVDNAKRANLDLVGSVCASDGFFPFTDSIQRLAELGVKCVIQPGGSKADPDVMNACDENNIAMVLTGRRHFRH